MTVHIKMFLQDGVSFRLLTAENPINIQVVVSDPELGGYPVLRVTNPPATHVLSGDAYIMNDKGDTISKIDFKTFTKAISRESIKPISRNDEPEELITGTPIFKPEKLEEQHRGAEYGAFIGMDFYPFYCISPTLVREHGVYASDEIIEALKKTKLVSYVFLALLKENAEKYNPESKTITVTDASFTVKKTLVIDPPDSGKLFEKVLPPESIDLLKDQLKQNTNVVFVIINSPGIIDNLMSSILVIEQSQGKYTCTAYYAGLISDPKDFTAEQLKAFIGNDEFTIFTASRDEIFTKLTLLPHIESQPDYYQTALARKRFYEEHPQLKEVLSSPQMSVSGIVSALRESSVSVSTGVQLAGVEEIEKLHYKIDIPSEIIATLSKSSLVILTNAIGDTIYKPFEGNILVKVTPDVNGYLVQVTLDTAHRVVELPVTHVAILSGEVMPAASKTYFKVYAHDDGKIVFDEVDSDSKATPNTDQMKQALFDSLVNIPVGIANHLNEDSLGKFKAFVIDHVKGLLRASVQITTTCGDGYYSNKVKVSTAQHLVEFPAIDTLINKGETYPPQSLTTWSVCRVDGNFAFALVEEN